MSAEEGSTQPPAAGSDKVASQPSKPAPAAAFTSSFINKNTTGKKFAPKAARRRPAAAPAPKPAAPEPTPPAVEAQTTRPESESSIAAEEPAAAAHLPTPVATQEQGISRVPEASIPAPEAPAVQELTPIPAEPLPTPASSSTEDQARVEQQPETVPAVVVTSQDDADSGRSTKRRRVESPTVDTETAVAEPRQPAAAETEVPAQTEQPTTAVDVAQRVEEASTQVAEESAGNAIQAPETAQATPDEPTAPAPRARRVLPWAAVNRPAEVDEGDAAPVAPKKARQAPKPRGRKKATAETETEAQSDGEQEGDEGDQVQQVRKRASAKARGKRKAAAAAGEDGTEETAPAPAKRARKPRKVKGVGDPAGQEEADEQAEEGQAPAVRRKPHQPRRRKQTATEGDGKEEAAHPKRRGRPPREPTPEDAEDHEIDTENTYMDNIASRNIRVGKLSAREKAMREIDWVAVKQRQREEDARPITTKETREAAEKQLMEQAPQDTRPQFLVVDGQIQLTHASNTLDREAQADLEIQNYEVVEERDLTTRITSRSFMKNNKRFPNDFLLPGQGKRWSLEETDRFYEGLRHFGTDFQMISQMFPGSTRRSIKLKFTREERENPDGIREILLSRSTIDTHWDDFMQVSQMEEQRFADADAIKREMAAHEAEMREKIKAAQAETDERKRQQREAGLLDDENGDDPNKENGKGKKKRKGKEKQVTFQEEAGVEILGNVDDDETWGQE